MSIIRTVAEDDATGEVAALYEQDRETFGYVTEHSKAMALNPEAEQAFQALVRAIQPGIGTRNYRLVTLAAAGALRSQPCLIAHGTFARRQFDDEQVAAIARDYHDAGLTPAEVAMMDFAVKLSTDAAAMTDADAQVLRDHGFSDREIVDITLAAAVRNYYSRALHALGVEDPVPESMPAELRSALLD
ncbi:MAG TPA: peroxidase-related enzyme [Pseudolysinimonas sp.]|jgi:uncharacterized peroxidase-related enzyme|nr:peroxidase-related enzyme [Pseudolysinimonas sp.]